MKILYLSLLSFSLLLASVKSVAQVPIYNSYPSAAATIYLDFDGHYVDGTSWNMNGPITCGPANLTTSQMTEIFNRVAEDYRPFNINITTDSTKYWSAPMYQRMRVVLTVTSAWYGSAGGVSYVGSFTWGDNTPAFVFTALLNYNTKMIAESAAHEVGHTLGLMHQASYDANCVKKSDYNYGQGTGEIGWAPIMGAGYYQNFTLWNNGANPYGCTYYQDDLAIITSSWNGFGYRADDYADTTIGSAVTSFINNHFDVSGVIERNTDKDVTRFSIPSIGNFHLDAVPYSVGTNDAGSNLDIQLTLLDSAQHVISVYNPPLLLSSSIDTLLNPGTYYISVAGSGNLYAQGYASLGSYSLKGLYNPGAILPLHQLKLLGKNENNKHQLDWIIEADETLTQQVLEVSSNGRDFQQLVQLNNSMRSYSYIPEQSGILYYRIHTTFDNRQQYYSNTIALRSNSINTKPFINGNLIYNSLTINSPASFSYSINDYNGRLVEKGTITQGINTIQISNYSSGMYFIKFTNNQQQYTEKFLKK
jgi:hypothetical protein